MSPKKLSLAALRSFFLGLIDLVYNLYRRFIAQPRRNRWFSAGYGDLQSYYYAVDNAMAEWKRDGLKRYLSKPLRVTWRKIDSGDPAVLCDEGFFVSPLSRYIGVPDAVKMARFLFVRAAPGGPLPPTRSIVVHTAATGVSTYAERDAEMARPLLAHGIASCILMAPYNGTRAPEGQRKHYIDNAAEAHLLALEDLAGPARSAGKAYFISNGEPLPVAEIMRRLLEAVGETPRIRRVPLAVARFAAAVVEPFWRGLRLKSDPPISKFMVEQLSTAHWFDLGAAARDLGYRPSVSIEAGLKRLAAAWPREDRAGR